jgi:AcrR family transcriptional regulator
MATDLRPSDPELPGAAAGSASPRERRRIRTKRLIQGEALRLFAENGYGQTTIEEIAEAADISPRTFFRYFPSKEDVVLWDEYDAVIGDLLADRPDDESIGDTARAITRQAIEGLYRHDPERLLARHRLLDTVPEIRASFLEFARSGVEVLTASFAAKRGLDPDDIELHVTAAAIMDAAGAAFSRWQRAGGKPDLIALFDQATDSLIKGIGEMQPSGAG